MTGQHESSLLALSLVIAVLTGIAALNLVQRVTLSRRLAARSWLTFGALSMGLGLWAVHFVLLLAHDLPIEVVYHVPTMLFALGLSLLMSFFALWVASAPRVGAGAIGVAGVCMGLGLLFMYYSGVFAMQIVPAVFHDRREFLIAALVAVSGATLMLALATRLREGTAVWMLVARGIAGAIAGAVLWWQQRLAIGSARFEPDSYSLGATGTDGNALLGTVAILAALTVLAVVVLTLLDHAHRASWLPHFPTLRSQRTGTTEVLDRAALDHGFDVMADTGSTGAALLVLDLAPSLQQLPGVPRELLLEEVARRLLKLVRPGDMVVRLEPERFGLLLVNMPDAAVAATVAARMRSALARTIQAPDGQISLRPRIGTAIFPRDGQDLDTLLRIASVSDHAEH